MEEDELKKYKNVVIDKGGNRGLNGLFASIFLPRGYPESVSKDYMQYQFWDSVQALCSSITGALAANAVFKGVGVGDETASAVAATTSWILRDGLSKCSAIAFAYYKGSRMDSECKKYRLLADGLNDLAMGVNLASPFLPPFYRNMVYCLSSVCWSIVGIAGGCTRTAMTIHQARKDNASDVQAKDNSQETLVGLVGLILSYFIVSNLGEQPFPVMICFIFFTILHLFCNYRAVRCVSQELFNINRLRIVARHFADENGTVLSVEEANQAEPIIFTLPEYSPISIGARLNDSSTHILSYDGVLLSRDDSGAIGVHLTRHYTSENLVRVSAAACLLESGISVGDLFDMTELFIAKLKEKRYIFNKNQLNPLEHRIILRS